MEEIDAAYTILSFFIVSVINTIIGLSTMLVLLHIGVSYWVSTFLGNIVGACISYLLNKSFTFQSKQSIKKTIYKFFVVIGVCYVFSYSVSIHLATRIIEQLTILPLSIVEDIAILFGTGIYTILNFVGQKRLVFSKS